MGFPAGYTEVLLPKLLINTLSLLGLIRNLILTFLRLFGLSDFLDPSSDDNSGDPLSLSSSSTISPLSLSSTTTSLSATLIREMLPAVKFSDCAAASPEESCAVCLYEFEDDDEIRRMRNCRHMFHRSCVDRWMDHDRKTCPLCRTPFVPDELLDAFNEKLWAASGIPDFYSDYSSPIANFL